MQTTKSCPTGQNCLKLSKNFTFIWLQTLTGANLKHWQAASSAVTLMQHWQVLCWVEKQHYFIFWFCLVCFCSLNVISKGKFLHDFFFFKLTKEGNATPSTPLYTALSSGPKWRQEAGLTGLCMFEMSQYKQRRKRPDKCDNLATRSFTVLWDRWARKDHFRRAITP